MRAHSTQPTAHSASLARRPKRAYGLRWTSLLPVSLLVAVGCLLSAVGCPLVWAEGFKVGYVDLARLFGSYERTRRSESTLEQKNKQKETELEQRLGELRKLREGLDLLSDEARDTRAREIDRQVDELRRLGAYTRQDLVKERNRITQEILGEIQQTIQEYASANGFSLILDERLLLYGQEVYDVTEEILKQLNAKETAGLGSSRR